MRHDETGWQRRKCIEKSLKNPPTVTHRHLPKKSLICQAMGFSATCAWRYLVDHFQARFPIPTMVDVDPPAASLGGWLVGWSIVTGTASGSSESKHSGKGHLEKVWHQWLCVFRGWFCNKERFLRTGFHQHETCHVTVYVSVVFIVGFCLFVFSILFEVCTKTGWCG